MAQELHIRWRTASDVYLCEVEARMKDFFFFSSRRRHTRWPRDWSSDVCSSDLGRRPALAPRRPGHGRGQEDRLAGPDRKSVVKGKSVDLGGRRIIKKKKIQK